MGTALFDTTVVPHWRDAGTLTTRRAETLRVGDPCHGLDPLTAKLPLGEWCWEVRDADEAGESVHRVWEVRLRRADQPPAQDLDWLDEYGVWRLNTDGWRIDGFRGVDAGIIFWEVAGRDSSFYDQRDDLIDSYSHAGPDMAAPNGRLLGTSTGWGDGYYPVAVRTVDGVIVEVRACYITPDQSKLTAERFAELIPGVFTGRHQLAAPYALHLRKHEYTAKENGDENNLIERSYTTVAGIGGINEAGREVVMTTNMSLTGWEEDDNSPYQYADADEVAKAQNLWGRLPAEERVHVVAHVVEGDPVDDPRSTTGWIVKATSRDVKVTLNLT